jgi:hypothetical protein
VKFEFEEGFYETAKSQEIVVFDEIKRNLHISLVFERLSECKMECSVSRILVLLHKNLLEISKYLKQNCLRSFQEDT